MKKNKTKEFEFEIKHYPLSGWYFPMCNGKFLEVYGSTGIIKIEGEHSSEEMDMALASKFRDEEDARDFIKRFKEQKFKTNVKTIKY